MNDGALTDGSAAELADMTDAQRGEDGERTGGERSCVNDQILDAVRALSAHADSELGDFALDLTRQAMVHAVVVAIQNAVAAQQRNYLLRQAVTASLVRHALEAPPETALKIIEPHLLCDDIAETLRKLKDLLDEVNGLTRPRGAPGA